MEPLSIIVIFWFSNQSTNGHEFNNSASLICVIIVAALIGTSVPIILDRFGIDPNCNWAIHNYSSDIIGIILFFYIAKVILVF